MLDGWESVNKANAPHECAGQDGGGSDYDLVRLGQVVVSSPPVFVMMQNIGTGVRAMGPSWKVISPPRLVTFWRVQIAPSGRVMIAVLSPGQVAAVAAMDSVALGPSLSSSFLMGSAASGCGSLFATGSSLSKTVIVIAVMMPPAQLAMARAPVIAPRMRSHPRSPRFFSFGFVVGRLTVRPRIAATRSAVLMPLAALWAIGASPAAAVGSMGVMRVIAVLMKVTRPFASAAVPTSWMSWFRWSIAVGSVGRIWVPLKGLGGENELVNIA